ncbi:MAG TPA: SDR family NAD(P)-dependent oxidoreductase [Steroidobacteraceae bacterium]|nr:SDR family NAD(P)-dependent oxidoreductase [Steroidobacteraceae bacterium]
MGAPLQGRHALVTGAGRGIGAAIAARLVAEGARVTLLSRTQSQLDQVAAALGSSAQTACADITDLQATRRAFEQAALAFGPVDVLINNAGRAQSAPTRRAPEELWHTMLAVNLTGTYYGIRAVLPGMLERNFGRIVNVASTAGVRGYPYVAAYCAAKHGVIGLTRALALEVAQRNITVNAVCPGYTDTDLVRESIANIEQTTGRSFEAARAALTKANPQGRLVQPAEVANAVAWLCLPGAEAITGQSIAVAGGEVM